MALALAFVNEVLNHRTYTALFDTPEWEALKRSLGDKIGESRLEDVVISRMALRHVPGGYDGMLATLADLVKENEELRRQLDQVTSPAPEPTHA